MKDSLWIGAIFRKEDWFQVVWMEKYICMKLEMEDFQISPEVISLTLIIQIQ